MFNKKRLIKIKILLLIFGLLATFFYLFSISKFNREYNCVAGNCPFGPCIADCQSFINYMLTGDAYGADGIMF